MNRWARWLDNPILVKHLRSRLRKAQFFSWLAVVLTLCLISSWAGWVLNGYTNGWAFGAILSIQAVILVVVGAAQIASAIGGARESGILDFHRVSPLTPLEVALGFFFGAPIREYVLFAVTLPFALFCVTMGAPDFPGLLQCLFVLVLAAWVCHALALLGALTTLRTKRGGIGIVLLCVFFGGPLLSGFSRTAFLLGQSPQIEFFGLPLPWYVFATLYLVPALVFLMLSSVRKMRSERAHPFSKPEAIACLLTMSVLLLGGVWSLGEVPYLVLVFLYTQVVLAMILTVTFTPTAAEYIKGIRRAEKLGQKRPRSWEDLAPNRLALFLLCGIVLVGSTMAWRWVEVPNANRFFADPEHSYSLPIAIGVLTVAYFGLAMQFFYFQFPHRGLALACLGLFLFLVWIVPLLIGVVVLAAGWGENASWFVLSMSPLVGMATSSGVETLRKVPQLGAVLPAVGFALVFQRLLTSAKRRLERLVRPPQPQPGPVFDLEPEAAGI